MFGHEFIKIIRKRFGFKRINGLTVNIQWKSGIRNAGNWKRGIFAEDADGFAHVFGASGTVETDDINAHAFEDGERGVDVGAEQHASGRVERDLGL